MLLPSEAPQYLGVLTSSPTFRSGSPPRPANVFTYVERSGYPLTLPDVWHNRKNRKKPGFQRANKARLGETIRGLGGWVGDRQPLKLYTKEVVDTRPLHFFECILRFFWQTRESVARIQRTQADPRLASPLFLNHTKGVDNRPRYPLARSAPVPKPFGWAHYPGTDSRREIRVTVSPESG